MFIVWLNIHLDAMKAKEKFLAFLLFSLPVGVLFSKKNPVSSKWSASAVQTGL